MTTRYVRGFLRRDTRFGTPSGARTLDTLIKSQVSFSP